MREVTTCDLELVRTVCQCGHLSECHAPAGPCEAFAWGHSAAPCACPLFADPDLDPWGACQCGSAERPEYSTLSRTWYCVGCGQPWEPALPAVGAREEVRNG